MERYPELTFMQNQGKVYDYCRRDFPELYEAVRQRVAEGRWEVNGAMWTEPDCNMPSGESLVRQLTFGLRYFEREFGGSGDALIVMDAFGYSWALPQLLRRCGLKHFLTNKMSWNQFNRLPYDSFIWRGIDGSTVVAHQLTAKSPGRDGWTTTCNAVLDAPTLAETWSMYQQKDQATAFCSPTATGWRRWAHDPDARDGPPDPGARRAGRPGARHGAGLPGRAGAAARVGAAPRLGQ